MDCDLPSELHPGDHLFVGVATPLASQREVRVSVQTAWVASLQTTCIDHEATYWILTFIQATR